MGTWELACRTHPCPGRLATGDCEVLPSTRCSQWFLYAGDGIAEELVWAVVELQTASTANSVLFVIRIRKGLMFCTSNWWGWAGSVNRLVVDSVVIGV